MLRKGPIVIIEDDPDDQEILKEVFDEPQVMNQLKFCKNCPDSLTFLKTTQEQPFLIISDVNLPVTSGIEMRKKINENEHLKKKSIPFVFSFHLCQ